MDAKYVERELVRFLSSSQPGVLCITGGWGVGKTFTFKRILGAAASGIPQQFNRYSYVSLFGLNSLDEVKRSIVENTVSPKDALAGPTRNSLKDLYGEIDFLGGMLKYFSKIPILEIRRRISK